MIRMTKLILAIKNPKLFARKIFGGIPRFYRLYISKDKFTINVRRFKKDDAKLALRIDYPSLNNNSIVFDVGGYEGDFAHKINAKYGCKVYIFEPHPKFYAKCKERFKNNQNIIILNYGLSNTNGKFKLTDSVDASSFYNLDEKNTVNCEVKNIFDVLSEMKIDDIDLMKINIEGGEYPLLQNIADMNKLHIVKHYQIQFHDFIDDASKKRNKILSSLCKTHHNTWCYEFVWENWALKTRIKK